MASRRKFVKQLGLLSGAFAAMPVSIVAGQDQKRNIMRVNETGNKAKVAVITWTYGISDLDRLFAKIRDTGFEAVQFCSDISQYRAEEVVRFARKHNIEILAYDPGACKPPAGVQPNIDNAVAYFTKIIAFAKAIGSPMVCLQGLSNWTKAIAAYQEAMAFIIEVVRRLDQVAAQHHIMMTYEACCHYELPWVQTADELLRIYNESGAKNLKLVLDSFHMNIAETDMLEPIRKIGNLLDSYHISDSGRGEIGTGHINFVAQYKTLQEVGFKGYVFLEIVIPECRTYKLPMNDRQMAEFIRQNQYSKKMWEAISS
ncbi:sugar phosphate isomerase/epimerase [Chryseobacterium sp. NEB161]|nr:sugar phosphate isomerase/epimerase [Chryseobacterium sp. NEB161]